MEKQESPLLVQSIEQPLSMAQTHLSLPMPPHDLSVINKRPPLSHVDQPPAKPQLTWSHIIFPPPPGSQSNYRLATKRKRHHNTRVMDRAVIKTASAASLSAREIAQRFNFSVNQVYYARLNSLHPRTEKNGKKSANSKTKSEGSAFWSQSDSSDRHIPLWLVPSSAPELNLHQHGMKAVRTAYKSQGYERRPGINKTRSRQMRLDYILNSNSEWPNAS
ncbi:hypothetical protein K3495_g15040 [Podosphaera aphanis]|nr:hypothetical protein K3495_g15040 [Podosphaera aphanis]